MTPAFAETTPVTADRWHEIGYQHAAAARARRAEVYALSSANKMIAAMKGAVRQAFPLGLMDAERYARVLAVKSVKGTRVPKGRALSQPELTDLLAACDITKSGVARDVGLLGLAYGAGLRRSESVTLDFADYVRRTGILVIRGKGKTTEPPKKVREPCPLVACLLATVRGSVVRPPSRAPPIGRPGARDKAPQHGETGESSASASTRIAKRAPRPVGFSTQTREPPWACTISRAM